jgi:Sigma 54 modulation/S30EA ribosomal protein C terminus
MAQPTSAAPQERAGDAALSEDEAGDSPVEIREKVHRATPMTLDQALYEMELVGHDFFLFCDSDTGHPSVVYRRRGWSYGVLRLETERQGLTTSTENGSPERAPAYSGSGLA